MKIIEKYSKLVSILSEGLVGKEDIIKADYLHYLAVKNMILIGPPGTAKSEIARRLTKVIKNGVCFEYLLTKFTTPEELFGPVSLNDLKNNVFKRQTDGYLPTAHIGFLDEIFKANSSILNSLLTIINEKVYHNGKDKEKSNIISVIGASNELPLDQEELAALYDRFLVRRVVGYLKDSEISGLYKINNKIIEVPEELKFSVEELKSLKEQASKITIGDEVKRKLNNIRKEIRTTFPEGKENIADRKFVKLINLIRISAYLNEREEVTRDDLVIISNCLWNDPANRVKIQKIVEKNL